MRVQPRQLQRAFDRLSAAVGEKHAVQPGPFREFARQRPLKGIVKQIRDVHRASRLPAHHAHQSRMRISQRIHGDAREKIEIFASLRIVEVAAAPRVNTIGGRR